MPQDKPILIIKTGSALPQIKAQAGDFEDMFCQILGADRCMVIDMQENMTLPKPEEVCAAVITGSPSMVTQKHLWSENTAKWIIKAHNKIPLLGVCYGHQLIAYALGGTVENNPNGREIGTVTATKQQEDSLLIELDKEFSVQVTHSQSVTALPDNATLLATTKLDPHHAFRVGKSTWGVQFHPEFSLWVIQQYLEARKDEILTEGLNWQQIYKHTHSSKTGARVLTQFKCIIDEHVELSA